MLGGLRKVILRKELEEEEEEVMEEEELEEEELEDIEDVEEQENVEETEKGEKEEDDIIDKITERLNEIENRLPRIDISINGLRRDIDSIREEIQKIDESMRDIMALYEVVSAQINPFVGSSKVTSLSVERIEALEKAVEEIENQISSIKLDLKIILRDSLNVRGIVEDVIYGGEFV